MREYFSNYGDIIEHQIMLDHVTGRSRGFGFVTFDSEEAVDKIFADGQLHELGGKQVSKYYYTLVLITYIVRVLYTNYGFCLKSFVYYTDRRIIPKEGFLG